MIPKFRAFYKANQKRKRNIYSERFWGIEGTPYEYHYLQEEHYALRRRGKLNFVIVRAKSPIEALKNLKGDN